MTHTLQRLALFVLVAAFALGPAVAAEDADSAVAKASETTAKTNDALDKKDTFDETIVVVARKREENVQEVPISITVLDAGELESRSVVDLSHLDQIVPNLEYGSSFVAENPSEANIFIRGIGQVDGATFLEPGVGLYVDGIYLRGQGAVLDLLDIERVEVLRGPQGTLFGRNTIGGAVNVVTRRPDGQRSAGLSADFGAFNRREFRGRLGGRLGEGLHASVAALSVEHDGWLRSRITGQNFNDQDRQAARLSLNLQGSDRVSMRWNSDVTRDRSTGSHNHPSVINPDAPFLAFYNSAKAAAGLPIYDTRWTLDDPDSSWASLDGLYRGDSLGTSLDISWTSQNVRLQSMTAYRSFDYFGNNEYDNAPMDYGMRSLEQVQDQFSQEMHVAGVARNGRFNWLVGGLYLHERPRDETVARYMDDVFEALEAAPGPVVAPPGVPAELCQPGTTPPGMICFGGAGNPFNLAFFDRLIVTGYEMETDSWAVFSEETWQLSDSVTLTTGLRYSRDEKLMDFYDKRSTGDFLLAEEGAWDAWTPRLSLTWQWQPERMLYFNVSRGFKSGGINGRPPGGNPFDPETVWTYEAGLKSEWWKRRLRWNSTVFFNDYRDIQFQVSPLDDINLWIENAGDGHIAGFDSELQLQVAGFVLQASVGHLDSELDSVVPEASPDMVGNTLPVAPEWSYGLGAQYVLDTEKGYLLARIDWSSRSKMFHDILNTPGLVKGGHELLQAHLSWAPPSNRWDVAVWGTNLTNERFIEHGLSLPFAGLVLVNVNRPREWGVTFQARF